MTGQYSVAVGYNALDNNQTGSTNTAIGSFALGSATGGGNVAVGFNAGLGVVFGNNNVHISNTGGSSDSGVIRIETAGTQTKTFISGIQGVTTGNNDAIPVVIDSNGQLGTLFSSRRYKEDIQDMGEASGGLMMLRPVTFRYRRPFDDGSEPIQFGLVAEEVAEVLPDLVARSADGQIETVKYQALNSMLLNEVQRKEKQIRALTQQNRKPQEAMERLEAAIGSASVPVH